MTEDRWMIDTRHIYKVCHLDHDKLRVGEYVMVCCMVSCVIAAAMIRCTTSFCTYMLNNISYIRFLQVTSSLCLFCCVQVRVQEWKSKDVEK